MTKRWLGKTTCDICETDCTKEEYFVDAATTSGPWALMCPACYTAHGVPMGQKYGPNTEKVCNLRDELNNA